MKRIMTFLCCIAILLNASLIYADSDFSHNIAEEKAKPRTEYFHVQVHPSSFHCLGPGDLKRTTFFVQNKSEHSLSVKLHEVRNINQSPLYDVFLARWKDVPGVPYTSFNTLDTAWLEIPANTTHELELEVYFPKECGNAYQGKLFHAEFIFACRGKVLEDVWIDTSYGEPEKAPVTHDRNGKLLMLWVSMLCVAVVFMRGMYDEVEKM